MSRSSVILSWEKPFLPQLVDHLLARCTEVPIDLSDQVIIVPTQQGGRRLRQSLAIAAAAKNSGVLAPRIMTPDQLIAPAGSLAAATSADVIAAWTALLQEADLNESRAVFPTDPPRRDASWATGLAQQLSSLQSQLGEHGLDFGDVAERVRETDRESERWAALAELELSWRNLLAEKDLVDPTTAKQQAAAENEPPIGITRVLVAGVIDPLPLSIGVLERWSEILPVEVISHGDADASIFDEWGRVRVEANVGRTIPLSDRAQLHVVRDGREAATLTASLASEYSATPRSLAVGAVDPRSIQSLELAFHGRSLQAHDPSGISLASTGLGLLAVQLLELLTDPRPVFLAQILRHPEFANFATTIKKWADDGAELLKRFDDTMNDHLPSDVRALIDFAGRPTRSLSSAETKSKTKVDLAAALRWLADLGQQFRRRRINETLRGALTAILGQREFNLAAEEDANRAEELEQLGEILDSFAEVENRFPTLTAEAASTVLKRTIQSARRFPKDLSDSWDLLGWLELSYEDAPHLVLVGLNEGSVPETIRGDIFLPNSLREFLGLRSNNERFRRDQILLETHLRARAQVGRVDLIVPRMSDSGDPLQPSRLLFCCTDEELVPRAKQLFAELPPPRATPARHAAWKLQPLPAPTPTSFSPSKLKAYLACPYRYYLRHILKMEAVEVGKHELSASTFGDFCHAALEQLGKDTSMREVLDPNKLADYLAHALETIARQQLGVVDSFALQVQLESGRARLSAAAAVEAEERAQGWRIEHCEQAWSLKLGEMVINGRIDRIDRNQNNGSYRLIDYKTSDHGKPPEQAHWQKHRPTDLHVLPASVFEMEGALWRWVDLQLPLYLLAMREKFGAEVSAGYFVLPKTKQATGIRLWTQLAPEHLLHAEATARAIGAAVANGRFWPPAKIAYADDFDYLFPDGVEASVDAAAMQALAVAGGVS